jgi:hypothetical protein
LKPIQEFLKFLHLIHYVNHRVQVLHKTLIKIRNYHLKEWKKAKKVKKVKKAKKERKVRKKKKKNKKIPIKKGHLHLHWEEVHQIKQVNKIEKVSRKLLK